ncbi:hypothetical protein [Thermomonas sp.]|uniref:hypothetical protein n=1 Tax=Thermomonas sp. TaxID=1971895 RepID=UPI0025E02E47|nr:hypothetical protein [Thermomonas sp.]
MAAGTCAVRPLTILLSTADRQVLVLRNAVEIGRTALLLDNTAPAIGTRAYLLLHASPDTATTPPGLPAARWQALSLPEAGGIGEDALRELFASQRIALPKASPARCRRPCNRAPRCC